MYLRNYFIYEKKKVSDRRTNIPKHLNLLSEHFEYWKINFKDLFYNF